MSSSLNELIKKLKEEAKAYESSGRRPLRYGDPAIGLEYNEINATYRVSKKMWDIDIARTPQVVRNFTDRAEVHGECFEANRYNNMVNYRHHRVRGKGR